uniref:MgrB n=2 Tax=Klebsiella pneumoniae TaxID=573 RepID=A0A097F1Q3_KLEPN|nr:MgrB [Klebsiella pneumoniae]AVE17145.1 mutant MgrB [Klebsiella pneumoniae subsp. pneumoniae]
MKKLRWFY